MKRRIKQIPILGASQACAELRLLAAWHGVGPKVSRFLAKYNRIQNSFGPFGPLFEKRGFNYARRALYDTVLPVSVAWQLCEIVGITLDNTEGLGVCAKYDFAPPI